MRNYSLDKEKWQERLRKKDIHRKHFTLEELYNRTTNRIPKPVSNTQAGELGLIKKNIEKRSNR